MIQVNEEQLRETTQAMRNCGESLNAIKCESINLTGNSEVLRNYNESFEKLQNVMSAYATLLIRDSEKIMSAGEALIQEDRDVMAVPIETGKK